VRYLMDTSAYWQGRFNQPAADRLDALAKEELLAVCAPVMLEVLFSARRSRDWGGIRRALDSLPRVEMDDPIAAVEVQGALARRGQHRMPVIDVFVAATAAEHGLTVLHYDRDFERLSEATGGKHEWVVPAGSGH
jgi:predicted nucleic acid-binding protein